MGLRSSVEGPSDNPSSEGKRTPARKWQRTVGKAQLKGEKGGDTVVSRKSAERKERFSTTEVRMRKVYQESFNPQAGGDPWPGTRSGREFTTEAVNEEEEPPSTMRKEEGACETRVEGNHNNEEEEKGRGDTVYPKEAVFRSGRRSAAFP